MAIRKPRGYTVNRPNYREVCEGERPTIQATALTPWSGLPDVRMDKVHDDPIVLDPGTVIGAVTYTGDSTKIGKVFPACLPTATGESEQARTLHIYGSSSAVEEISTMPAAASGDITNIGFIKPLGVCFQPIYSSLLETAFTNYKRTHSTGFLSGPYVVEVPCISAEEVSIDQGDLVVLGSGKHYGSGWNPYDDVQAGRYAVYDSSWAFAAERVVGRALKRIKIATTSASNGTKLATDLDTSGNDVAVTTEFTADFGDMNKTQTTPGLQLTGSGTKGIPASLLDARAHSGAYYCFRFLVRV